MLELEEQPFYIHDCVEDALDLLLEKASSKKIELAYFLDENIPNCIVGDITRLRQILVNLISNAVKFTNEGEVLVSVKSKKTEGNKYKILFSVKDTGIGIPEDKMNRLFRSFSQVDSSTTRNYGGTGLGLAICKRLVNLMGGEIWVESEAGKGSTFNFFITAEIAQCKSVIMLNEYQNSLKDKRILVVDDNETNRKIITTQLRSWGFIPFAYKSGKEALELIKSNAHFDLAILGPAAARVHVVTSVFILESTHRARCVQPRRKAMNTSTVASGARGHVRGRNAAPVQPLVDLVQPSKRSCSPQKELCSTASGSCARSSGILYTPRLRYELGPGRYSSSSMQPVGLIRSFLA